MRHTLERPAVGMWLAASSLCMLLGVFGCGNGPDMRLPLQAPGTLKEMSLAALKSKIVANAAQFRTLKADCDIVLYSDQIQIERPGLRLSGRLELLKPGSVRLRLYYQDRGAIDLIGDGQQYVVRTPIFIGSTPYGGEYGDPVTASPDRIHFLPEDVADALDLDNVFAGTEQVLRAYPTWMDRFIGSFQTPRRAPESDVPAVSVAPVWQIDSVFSTDVPVPGVRALNSITIDRQTEQMVRLDKFRWDGSLRTRIWYASPRPIRVDEDTNVEIPTEFLIWYPPPLEGTEIYVRLSRIELNAEISEARFSVGD